MLNCSLDILKEECIRLRLEERLSINQIKEKTGAKSKSTLSLWLKPYPLNKEEIKEKILARKSVSTKKPRLEDSENYNLSSYQKLTRSNKGKISEQTVKLNLMKENFIIYKPVYAGTTEDFIIKNPKNGSYIKIQIKCATQNKIGLPSISLIKCSGNGKEKRYEPDDFDFIIGYDFRTDKCYIFSQEETKDNENSIAISIGSQDAWFKIHDFI